MQGIACGGGSHLALEELNLSLGFGDVLEAFLLHTRELRSVKAIPLRPLLGGDDGAADATLSLTDAKGTSLQPCTRLVEQDRP